MPLKHGILGLLSLNSASGYDLSKLFSESLNYFWMANQSQIYRELDKMEQGGWVCSEIVEQSIRPNKRIYSITKAGAEELLKWLKNDGVDQLMVMRSSIMMKVFFANKINRENVINLLELFKKECLNRSRAIVNEVEQIGHYEESAANPAYWKYTTDYCIGYYEFQTKWAEETIERLKNLT